MKDKRPSEEQLIALAKADPRAIARLVLSLLDRVEKLEAIVDKLEAKILSLESNSRSSSKPPSTDKGNFTNPPKPKSLHKKSGCKPGGQKGHRGSNLEKRNSPDHIVDHHLPEGTRCYKCGAPLDTGKREELDHNQAERDLQMMKVREKIRGTFRAEAHAKAFCDIRGIIFSARKQSYVMRETLADLIVSPIPLGKKLAEGK